MLIQNESKTRRPPKKLLLVVSIKETINVIQRVSEVVQNATAESKNTGVDPDLGLSAIQSVDKIAKLLAQQEKAISLQDETMRKADRDNSIDSTQDAISDFLDKTKALRIALHTNRLESLETISYLPDIEVVQDAIQTYCVNNEASEQQKEIARGELNKLNACKKHHQCIITALVKSPRADRDGYIDLKQSLKNAFTRH